jgi:type VI secretion system protein ImpF
LAELISSEKLQPCLLDRLTDLAPERDLESAADRVVSLRRYREGVLRDVGTLLRTPKPTLCDNLAEFPEVEKSVLNYGMRDLCGSVSATHRSYDLARELRRTLECYEPRLDPASLTVETVVDPWKTVGHEIGFEIKADLWANPQPEELQIRTTLDLETGEYSFKGQKPA